MHFLIGILVCIQFTFEVSIHFSHFHFVRCAVGQCSRPFAVLIRCLAAHHSGQNFLTLARPRPHQLAQSQPDSTCKSLRPDANSHVNACLTSAGVLSISAFRTFLEPVVTVIPKAVTDKQHHRTSILLRSHPSELAHNMSGTSDDQKRRPPPIHIPPPLPRLPHALPPRPSSRQQHHGENRNASSSTQQGPRTVSSPLTSPLEHDGLRNPFTSGSQQSGSQKSRVSAINALTTLMEESRASSRKSDQGSTIARSTTRSRHSERSQHSAAAAQAQLEALDEDERTSRAKIEARSEVNLFKMTGQVPPTPMMSECEGKVTFTGG